MDEIKSIFGYTFAEPRLLETALTTPSCRMSEPEREDNQRLEFLGDAVINFLAADRAYHEFPAAQEGELTVKRTHMVSTQALCASAVRLGLKDLLRRSKGASPVRDNSKELADAMEALVGAAWLDGGLDAARQLFDAFGIETNAQAGEWAENPKGLLQNKAQSLRPHRRPVYETLSVGGVSHEPIFTVRVEVPGVGTAEAEARSRKEAEAAAAARLLAEGNWK